MSSKINDKDVLQLLANLKNTQSAYPEDMIKSRRDDFTKQAAALAVLMKAGGSTATATGSGQAVSTTAATSSSAASGIGGASLGTILETALVVAIVAEAGIATYVYREKIAEFINSTFGPKVEQVANPPDNSPEAIPSIESVTGIPTESPTATVTESPLPPSFTPSVKAENSNNNGGGGDIQVTSTPDPNQDNGLHLGQTKQPTKQPNNKNNNK